METEEKKIKITEMNEEALFADGFGKALVGYARRCGQPTLAVYDAGKCIEILIEMGLSRDEAIEHFEFNVVGAWVGDHTPIYMFGFEDREYKK
jgi:hypothetical protein